MRKNSAEAVDIILGLLGEQYEADRAYIFEYNVGENAVTSSNTHEWCADNVVPQIDKLQNVPLEAFSLWMSQLENNSNILLNRLNPSGKRILKIMNCFICREFIP